MELHYLCVVLFASLLWPEAHGKLKPGECEVCIKFMEKFMNKIDDTHTDRTDQDATELLLFKTCKEATGKEERLCYYVGATDIAATKLVREATKPIAQGKPAEKVCEDLKKRDTQICELQYEQQIDLNTVDFKTLRVKDLKKILNDLGGECKGCTEKRDFIDKIEQIKKKEL
ncbi:hypothetical protein EMCRGX_G001447 [Ephydatia muelleri]|eukprot:Em0001g1293a